MAKRIRTDGHLRREEYEALEQQAERASRDSRAFDPTAKAGTFSKASTDTIQRRRIVKINRRPKLVAVAANASNTRSSSSSSTSNPFAQFAKGSANNVVPASVNPFAAVSLVPPSSTISTTTTTTATTSTTVNLNPFASITLTTTTAAAAAATTTTASPLPVAVTLGTTNHNFVLNTFRSRIPKIMDDTAIRIATNGKFDFSNCRYYDRWKALRNKMSNGPAAPIVLLEERPENVEWNKHLAPLIVQGKTMQQVDTLLLENLFYRHLLDACEYWDNNEEMSAAECDPFRFHKAEALSQALLSTFQNVATLRSAYYANSSGAVSSTLSKNPKITAATLRSILLLDLWGNRADLSLSAGKVELELELSHDAATNSNSSARTMLLADDIDVLWTSAVFQAGGSKDRNIAIVLDNCGLELCTDLVLCEMLLSSGAAATVTLYAKEHPVFVSDAMCHDVHQHIAALSNWKEGTDKSFNLDAFVKAGRLIIKTDPFFTSGYSYESMATEAKNLHAAFVRQDLVIFKGDANYRRLMGEKTWNQSTSFSTVVAYMPFPVLAIRTLKYPLSCGAKVVEINKAKERYGVNEWDCVGKCGVIHFKA
jgi:hypothetical protein